jgi:hypothetical protein
MHPHTKYHWPISKDKNVMARTRKYYLKNNYLTLRSQMAALRGDISFRYLKQFFLGTHCTDHTIRCNNVARFDNDSLMVMHPHTKYHWPISKETIILPWGQSPTKVITIRDTPPYGHAPTYQISLTYLERQKCYGPNNKILFKKQIHFRRWR